MSENLARRILERDLDLRNKAREIHIKRDVDDKALSYVFKSSSETLWSIKAEKNITGKRLYRR